MRRRYGAYDVARHLPASRIQGRCGRKSIGGRLDVSRCLVLAAVAQGVSKQGPPGRARGGEVTWVLRAAKLSKRLATTQCDGGSILTNHPLMRVDVISLRVAFQYLSND